MVFHVEGSPKELEDLVGIKQTEEGTLYREKNNRGTFRFRLNRKTREKLECGPWLVGCVHVDVEL